MLTSVRWGLPFNGDWRAQYVVLEREGAQDTWRVEFRQILYDREAFAARYRTSGFLEAGNVVAAMLLKELEYARPFLVPFLKWCEALDRPDTPEQIEDFLDFYDPDLPLEELRARLHEVP